MASTEGAVGSLGTQLARLELNVLIGGAEAAVGTWIVVQLLLGGTVIPSLTGEWQWAFAVLGILTLIGVYLLGLTVEGVAGILERLIKRRLGSGELRPWYERLVQPPADWGPAQRWMWKSPEAAAEFGRRRARMLIARNTACSFMIFPLALIVGSIWSPSVGWESCLVSLVVLLIAPALFVWIWMSAESGWNQAVRDAGEIGDP